jgi:hypothetical protein
MHSITFECIQQSQKLDKPSYYFTKLAVRSRQQAGRQADIETDKKAETQTDTRIMLENIDILFN